jgi:hypothetical protein
MARRWLPVVLSLALTSLLGACGPGRDGPGLRQGVGAGGDADRQTERQRQAAARIRQERQRWEARCLRERPELEARMADLRRAEADLARVKEEFYVPSAPPPAWDEAAESRFRREDRDADWQRHQQERDRWVQRERERRGRWTADRQERLAAAQERLNAEARALRNRRADLFTGPGSIAFQPEVEEEIRRCQRLDSRWMGKTAQPRTPQGPSPSVTVPSHSDTIQ